MKKVFWMGTLGLAVLGMLLPQFAIASTQSEVKTITVDEQKHDKRGFHHKIDKKEMQSLLQKGYSKQDVFQAALIARLSDKNVEGVLKYYKQSKSWEKTAEYFGVDQESLRKHKAKWRAHKEQFEQHHDEILRYIGTYSGTEVSELKGYLKDDIRFPHLIKAAVVAKLSGQDIKEVIEYKKEGHSRQDMINHFHIDEKELHTEMKAVWTEIQNIVKE